MGRFADWVFGAPVEATTEVRADEPSSAIVPPARTSSDRTVAVGDAFGLAMVYRAISIHVTAVKQLGMEVYRNDAKIDTPTLLKRPNINATRSVFMEQTVVSLACDGNAFWRITRDAQSRITNLEVLNPLDMQIETDSFGIVTGYNYQGKTLRKDTIKHLALLRVPGKARGLGPIQAAQVELRGAIDTRDYGSNWFTESGVPNGILKSDNVLSPDQASAAREAWQKSGGAKNGVAVLGNGLNYQHVYLNPEDAQFIQNQQFNVTQVARLFGVPASLMLASTEGSSQTYQNVEQDWLGYVRFSLMQYLVEIEDAFSSLLPGAQETRFKVETLLRSDTTTRYTAHQIGLDAGFLTVPEVRKIEHLDPLTDTPEATA